MKFNQICEHIMTIDSNGHFNIIRDTNNNVFYNGHCYDKTEKEFQEEDID
jgi:hypothetical protein